MTWPLTEFPDKLDFFPKLIEGWHADVPDDYNYIAQTLGVVERVLGLLPSGQAATVSDRLDGFLRSDGYPLGVQIVTVSTTLADLAGQITVLLNYSFSSLNYTPIITSVIQDQTDDGVGWNRYGQNQAHVESKTLNSFTVRSKYYPTGGTISVDEGASILMGFLVVHEDFTEG